MLAEPIRQRAVTLPRGAANSRANSWGARVRTWARHHSPRSEAPASSKQLSIVLHWTDELKRIIPSARKCLVGVLSRLPGRQ